MPGVKHIFLLHRSVQGLEAKGKVSPYKSAPSFLTKKRLIDIEKGPDSTMNHVQARAAAIKEHGRLSTLNNPPGARNYQDSLRLQRHASEKLDWD